MHIHHTHIYIYTYICFIFDEHYASIVQILIALYSSIAHVIILIFIEIN